MPAFHNVIAARLERDVLLQQIRDKPKAWFVEKIVIWHGPVTVIDLAHRRLLAADARCISSSAVLNSLRADWRSCAITMSIVWMMSPSVIPFLPLSRRACFSSKRAEIS